MDSFISIDLGTAAVAFDQPAAGVAAESASSAPASPCGTHVPSDAAVEAFQAAMAKPIADNAAVEAAFDSAVKAFSAAVAAVEKTVSPVAADAAGPEVLEVSNGVVSAERYVPEGVASVVRDVPEGAVSVVRDAHIPPQLSAPVAQPAPEGAVSVVRDVPEGVVSAGREAPVAPQPSAPVAQPAPEGAVSVVQEAPVAPQPSAPVAQPVSEGVVSVVREAPAAPQPSAPVAQPAPEGVVSVVRDAPVVSQPSAPVAQPAPGGAVSVVRDVPAAPQPSAPVAQPVSEDAVSVVRDAPEGVVSVVRDAPITPQQVEVSPRRVEDNVPYQAVAASDADEAPEARAENIIAAGVVPQQQVAAAVGAHVADPSGVQAVDAVSARTVEVAERVTKAMSASEVLIQAAEAVADTILVSPGLLRGEGEIRVQLRPDVLDGTEIRIGVSGRQLDVAFMPSTADMSALIEQCRPQLEQHLAARIHRFSVSVSVSMKARGGDD